MRAGVFAGAVRDEGGVAELVDEVVVGGCAADGDGEAAVEGIGVVFAGGDEGEGIEERRK